jgi:nucleotide-binding universal stress UspA family protein
MKVLIAIDNSHCSHEAVKSVLKRPWFKDTEFRVIHVVEPIVSQYSMVAPQAIGLMVNAEKVLREEGVRFTAETAEKIRTCVGVEKVSSRVIDGFVADAIIDHARWWQADLIVVGSHGRTGMERLLLGSVAEKIANHANCSVDVIKMNADTSPETEATSVTCETIEPAIEKQKTLVS